MKYVIGVCSGMLGCVLLPVLGLMVVSILSYLNSRDPFVDPGVKEDEESEE